MGPIAMLRRQRLLAEHIECGAIEMAAVEQLEQALIDDQSSARDVDHIGTTRQQSQRVAIEFVLSRRCQRRRIISTRVARMKASN